RPQPGTQQPDPFNKFIRVLPHARELTFMTDRLGKFRTKSESGPNGIGPTLKNGRRLHTPDTSCRPSCFAPTPCLLYKPAEALSSLHRASARILPAITPPSPDHQEAMKNQCYLYIVLSQIPRYSSIIAWDSIQLLTFGTSTALLPV